MMAEISIDFTATAVDFDPFAGPVIDRLIPITEPQAEIWLACLLGGDDASRAYNESVSLRLTGFLDTDALNEAVQELIRRHESLRAAFSGDGAQLCVFAQRPVDVFFADCSAKSPAENEQFIADYNRRDAEFVFNLVEGPLLKVGLIKLADDAHHLTLTAHHIICDGWSLGIMLQDLSQGYSAYARHRVPDLPPAELFSAYADGQFDFMNSSDYRAIEQFWLAQYRGHVPVVSLPTDFPRPAVRTFTSERRDYGLDETLVQAVKKIGARAGCSFVTTLLAAFEVFVYRLTGQESLVIGLPAAGQSATGAYRLVGHCVNLLPLRSHLTGNQPFTDFLKQRRGELFDAYEQQRLTFGSLLRKLNLARDASRVPLVPVVFNIDMGLADGVDFYGLSYQLISNPRAYENFELFLNATGTEKTLVLEWSYNSRLFRADTIDRMMAGFEGIVRQIVAEPEQILRAFQLPAGGEVPVPDQPRHNTARSYPADKTLHQLIAEQAQATPNRVAVRFGTTKLSYRDLDEKSSQLAHYLLAQRVNPGDRIGLSVDRSAELLVALLAIMKCGAAYVPLDPGYPRDRLAFMLADSGARLLITSETGAADLQTDAPVISLDEVLADLTGYPKTDPALVTDPAALLYVLYTSGSTGQPKGVQITHRNVVNFLWSMRQTPGLTEADNLLAITTVSFDIAGLELFLPLVAGATVVLADAVTVKDGTALLRLIETEQITVMQATPSTWRMLLETGWSKKLPIKALSGGEALPPDLARSLVARCGSVWNMYGPTETTIWSSVKQITGSDECITIGTPIANTQLYVLDDQLQPVADNTVGELFIGGDGVASGYLNRPALTADRFVADPFVPRPGQTMYRTGDLGKRLPSGEIQCLGRVDQQIKLRGYRIEPGEIEHALMTFADVRQAVVVARETRPGDQRLVAHIVLHEPVSGDALRERAATWRGGLKAVLPDYMVPAEFVLLDAVPLTPNGKIDRNALLVHPVGSEPLPAAATRFMGPRTDVEKLVADIWAEALHIDGIGIFDNFFELGGHSLIAVQVMNRLEKKTGRRLPLAALFEHSTVEQLALMLQMDGKSITWDSLVPIKPQGGKTPLYIIHGAGLNVLLFNALAVNLDADQPVYGLQAKGLNGTDEPLESIEAIAAHYVASILAQNPTGPYALAGYSFGGIIAYEMTRQFEALGKTVNMLAMFDTYAYQSTHHDPWYSKVACQIQSMVKKVFYTFVLLKQDPRRAIEYKKDRLLSALGELTWKLRRGKEDADPLGISYKIEYANEMAWRNYRLVPYPVSIELFRARKLTFYMDDFEFLGWKPFALKGINIHEMPGEHNYIFAPPNDKEFAAILQKVLDAR